MNWWPKWNLSWNAAIRLNRWGEEKDRRIEAGKAAPEAAHHLMGLYQPFELRVLRTSKMYDTKTTA